MRKKLGKYIVVDSSICHGQPTFTGTRIMVHQVLEQVAHGTNWEIIQAEWYGKVDKAAIAEAIRVARQVFVDKFPIQ